MAIQFPTNLPAPKLLTYKIDLEDIYDIYEMDSGASRHRRNKTKQVREYELEFILNRDEFLEFEIWYESKAKNGEEAITIQVIDNAGLATKDLIFLDRFTASLSTHENWILNIRAKDAND